MRSDLQWGGRFAASADDALLAFGSSLEDDLILAAFDVKTSLAHVSALERGRIIDAASASALRVALLAIAQEVESGEFVSFARKGNYEDVHGAIDARVRERTDETIGAKLHTARSRNDQVATTLRLYVADRARAGARVCRAIAQRLLTTAREELAAGTLVAATTHWQPAQPVLLAFWLHAAAEPFIRRATACDTVAYDALRACPLGSQALAGSTLALDRAAAARELGFGAPTRNAMDAVGDRDSATDLVHAIARALVWASRVSEELVIWCTPAFGYARLADAASTGSSAMPQKRNPDPFELVRAAASSATGALVATLGTQTGIALSYHRDLQETKANAIRATERGLAALGAFKGALLHVTFNRERMTARAGEGYTVATDVAEELVANGVTARDAHRWVGERVTLAEAEGRALEERDLIALAKRAGLPAFSAPIDARASVNAKRTEGSTNPDYLAAAIAAAQAQLDREEVLA